MVRSFRLTFCILALLASLCGHSQYYNLYFRNFNSSSGLSLSEVVCMFEDSRGFLWVGTSYGITRYDGRSFRTFIQGPDDPVNHEDNTIEAITEDSHGNMWFAVYNGGLLRMDPVSLRMEMIACPSSGHLWRDLKPYTLEVDEKDRIWVGTEHGLFIYDPETGRYTEPAAPSSFGKGTNVLKLSRDAHNRVWVGTKENGLYYREPGSLSLSQVSRGEVTSGINGISFSKGGKGWLATRNGLFSLDRDSASRSWEVHRAPFFPQNEPLIDVLVDDRNNLWMATPEKGLLIYFPITGYLDVLNENYTSARGLLSNRLFSLFRDNRGGVWVAGENGLQGFNGNAQIFNIYPGLTSMSNELRGASIYGIYETDNDLLLATSGGVLIYNRLTNRYVPLKVPKEIRSYAIRYRTFTRTGKNKWLLSSDKGIYELVRQKENYELRQAALPRYADTLHKESIRKCILEPDGSMWIATTGDGLFHLDMVGRKMDYYRHDPSDAASLCDDNIYVMDMDRQGNLMIGTDNGLTVMDRNTRAMHSYRFDAEKGKGLNNRMVYDVFDDGANYWIATMGGGLNKVGKASGHFSYLTTRDGLSSNAIYTLIPQDDSVLWLGTVNGLSRFSLRNSGFRSFDVNDGMTANEFNMSSKFMNEEGEIFMATISSVISFKPGELGSVGLNPGIHLSRIRKNGRYVSDSLAAMVNTDRIIEYNYGDDIYLEYSPMAFFGNNNYSLKYKVEGEGQDGEWKEGEAGYMIPLVKHEPGNYRLSVQIFENPGMRPSPVWEMRMTVVPPFQKTVAFRLIAAGLFLLAAFLAIRSYILRRLKRQRMDFEQQQLIEKERSRISSELHDDIGGGLTAIRLMSEMVKDSEADEERRGIFLKISNASNELVQKMNEIVWALNVNQDDLPSLIAYTRRFSVSYLDDMGIRAYVTVPEDIPDMRVTGVNRRHIFLLVKEALNNLVKHSGATEAEIQFIIDGTLRILIRDNGRGFFPASGKRQGNGLANMEKRAAMMGGRFAISGDAGTTVSFTIPLDRLGT
jgi:ligand-binding sensor domain-containing protein/signal transduction histidine kinase